MSSPNKPGCSKECALIAVIMKADVTQSLSMFSARSKHRGTVSAELLSCDCTGIPAGLLTMQISSSM